MEWKQALSLRALNWRDLKAWESLITRLFIYSSAQSISILPAVHWVCIQMSRRSLRTIQHILAIRTLMNNFIILRLTVKLN